MPESLGTLVAFLLLITPGLAFELMRERRRPAREYSTFRETSIVVVASVVFSASALLLLYMLRSVWPGSMPDPGPLLDDTATYVEQNTRLVARALVVQVALATTLAWASHRALRRRGPDGDVSANSAWFEVTSGAGNPDRARVVASVLLGDGTMMTGYLFGNDTREGGLQDLILRTDPARPIHVRHPKGETDTISSDGWHYVIIPANEVTRTTIGLEQMERRASTKSAWQRWVASFCRWLLPDGH